MAKKSRPDSSGGDAMFQPAKRRPISPDEFLDDMRKQAVDPAPSPIDQYHDWLCDMVEKWSRPASEDDRPGTTRHYILDRDGQVQEVVLLDDAPAWIYNCLQAMASLRAALPQVEDDDSLWFAANHLINAGRYIERAYERRKFEPLVASALNQRPGRVKGAAAVNADFVDLHPEYKAAVRQCMADGMKYTPATEQVAKQFGVSGRTVRRNTRELAPSQRKSSK